MNEQIYTRNEYMQSKGDEQRAAHRKYYAQFVTPAVLFHVASFIGKDRIFNSTDEHFNDIPLHEWDRLEPFVKQACNTRKIQEANNYPKGKFPWSLSDAVCIAKQAARMIKETKI